MTESFFVILQWAGYVASIALLLGLLFSFIRKTHGAAFALLFVAVGINLVFAWIFATYLVNEAWGIIPAAIVFFLGPVTPLVGAVVGAIYFGMDAAMQVLWPLILAALAAWRLSAIK